MITLPPHFSFFSKPIRYKLISLLFYSYEPGLHSLNPILLFEFIVIFLFLLIYTFVNF